MPIYIIFLISVAKKSPNSKPLSAFNPKVQTKSITTKVQNTHKQAFLIRGIQDKSPLCIMLKTPSAVSAPKARLGSNIKINTIKYLKRLNGSFAK